MSLVTGLVLGASVVLTTPALLRTASSAVMSAAYHVLVHRLFFRTAAPRHTDAETQTRDDSEP